MNYSLVTLTLCWLIVEVLGFVPIQPVNAFHRTSASLDESASAGDDNNAAASGSDRPKNMVDTKIFLAAVNTLEGKTDSEAEETPYAIGKIDINLSIVGTPGLDLAEAPGLLVLVSSVSGNAAEVGIQMGDTIVSIGAAGGTFQQETKGLTLEETAAVLMAAANHAIENGLTEVELEINRLIKLAYSD
jgi:hypothetical protein